MILEPCFFSWSFRDFHFFRCCNSPRKSKNLKGTTSPNGCCFDFLRDKSALVLSKTFTIVDAILSLICVPCLKKAVENFCTFPSITRPIINGLPRVKLVMHSASLLFKVFLTSLVHCNFSETFSLSTPGWLNIHFGNILLLDLVHSV